MNRGWVPTRLVGDKCTLAWVGWTLVGLVDTEHWCHIMAPQPLHNNCVGWTNDDCLMLSFNCEPTPPRRLLFWKGHKQGSPIHQWFTNAMHTEAQLLSISKDWSSVFKCPTCTNRVNANWCTEMSYILYAEHVNSAPLKVDETDLYRVFFFFTGTPVKVQSTKKLI